MNAETFYEEMKEIIRYFGLSWNNKHLITISIREGNEVVFSYEGRHVAVTV